MQCGHPAGRACLAFAAAGLVAACGDSRGTTPTVVEPPPVAQPPTPSWNVVGTVRGGDRSGLAGVTVTIVSGRFSGRSTVSDEAGMFRFPAVFGEMAIAASKDGYERYLQTFNITTDLAMDIQLVRAVPADSIALGGVIESSVSGSALPCDPVRWDATAPCKRFVFIAPASGMLSIAITWSGGPELDATLVTLTNAYIATSTEIGPGKVELSGPITAGQAYEVRVNAYYGGQVFTLRAELH